MAKITINDLLEAGCHFGHQTRRWNPRMKDYVYGAKNGISIIDLTKTMYQIAAACNFLQRIVANGGDILFVGTKRQIRELVRNMAEETGMLVRATELAFVIEGKKSAAHRVDLVFHCEIEGEAIGVAHQGDVNQVGTAWIPLDTLEQEPLYPSRLRRAISEWYRGGNPGIYLGNEDEGDPEV